MPGPYIPHPPTMALWSFFLAALSRPPVLAVPGLLPSVGWGAVLFLVLPVLVPAAVSSSLPFLPVPAASFVAPVVLLPLSVALPGAPGSPAPLLPPLGFQWLCSPCRVLPPFSPSALAAGFPFVAGPVPFGGCLAPQRTSQSNPTCHRVKGGAYHARYYTNLRSFRIW